MTKLKIERPEEKKRVRKRNIAALVVVLVLLTPFLLGGMWLWFQINSFGSAGKPVTINIPTGTGTTGIGDILEDKDVVRSGTAFAVYSRLANRGPYQAGQYSVPTNISASEAATVLEKGPKINYEKFSIIPGQRLIDVQNNVDDLPELSGETFGEVASSGQYRSRYQPTDSTNLEGLLLPETYSISDTETEANIIQRALQEFDARAQANGLTGDANGLSPYEIIIVASLIEKEARYVEDRPLIASVIYNRLAIDMRLQIDASVIYGAGRSGGSLSRAELQTDTPYNTYTRSGLPPTPISMISMASLRAALNPAESNYLYYVISDAETGEHAFAETFEEHLVNIQKAKDSGDL
jgi:UPF0755 protein